jgi:hypothetical protein
MRRPTFLRVYSSDATEKDDEATPINRSDSDDVRNSIDNNELHLYTELHNDEQMLMFRPTMALEGPVARSYFDGTSGYKHASAVELGLGVGSFVSMGSTTLLPETSDVAAAATLAAGFVLLLLPIQVHPPGGKQGLTAALGCLAWAGVRRLLCRPPGKSPERRALINNR